MPAASPAPPYAVPDEAQRRVLLTLYVGLGPALRGGLVRRGVPREEAEDVVQDFYAGVAAGALRHPADLLGALPRASPAGCGSLGARLARFAVRVLTRSAARARARAARHAERLRRQGGAHLPRPALGPPGIEPGRVHRLDAALPVDRVLLLILAGTSGVDAAERVAAETGAVASSLRTSASRRLAAWRRGEDL